MARCNILLLTFSLLLAGTVGTVLAEDSPRQKAQMQSERMQLEAHRKQELMRCEKLKEAKPEAYNRCMGRVKGRHMAETRMLMQNPEAYFAKKAKKQGGLNIKKAKPAPHN